jgi:thiamine biosynthesis lipoprotein
VFGSRHAISPAITVAFAPPRLVREFGGATMGTSWTVTAVTDAAFEPGPLRQAVERRLEQLVAQLSHWDSDSALSRFNRAAGGQWVPLPDDLCRVLGCALALARETGGAFDPAAGALVATWGFGPRAAPRGALPSPAQIERARQRSGWTRIEFDAQRARARQPGGIELDLSGIAKGYAVDQVAAVLRRFGIPDCLVEIGGELLGVGRRADGRPWQVAIATPASLRAPRPPIVALSGQAIATSGDQWHAWTIDGRRYAHTIDPRTGRPVDDALACVTVLHDECMRADALATALLVLGPEAGLAFARQRKLRAAFALREQDGRESIRVTGEFEELLQ